LLLKIKKKYLITLIKDQKEIIDIENEIILHGILQKKNNKQILKTKNKKLKKKKGL